MNRIAGIAVAAVGVLIIVLSLLKVAPGLTQVGISLILFGAVIVGLSFIGRPGSDGTTRESTAWTLTNIFVSPSEVFQQLKRHPRWLAAGLVMAVLSGVYGNLFLYRLGPDRVANYAIDKTLEMSFLNDEARRQIEAGRKDAIAEASNPVTRAGQAISGFAWSVIGYAFLAAIFLLFVIALGGQINFWQAFSVVIYAAFPVAVIRFVLNTVLLFVKDPAEIHPITGQTSLIQDNPSFLVTASENPAIYMFLTAFSLLGFYWMFLNAVGLKNGGERVSSSTAWTAAIAVYVVMMLLGVVMALLFPSFIS